MQHTPPSTYILRDLIDVQAAPSVSWWPGFEQLPIGWWFLIALASLLIFALSAMALRHIYKNRYRREALNAVRDIMLNAQYNNAGKHPQNQNQQISEQLFYTLKQVLFYLDPQTAKLNDNAFFNKLDACCEQGIWQTALTERWMNSLYHPNSDLNDADISCLVKKSKQWIRNHRNHFPLRSNFLSVLFREQ